MHLAQSSAHLQASVPQASQPQSVQPFLSQHSFSPSTAVSTAARVSTAAKTLVGAGEDSLLPGVFSAVRAASSSISFLIAALGVDFKDALRAIISGAFAVSSAEAGTMPSLMEGRRSGVVTLRSKE